MKIETKFLGQVEIEEQDILFFEEGLPGFSTVRSFVLLPIDADAPLVLLQSIEQAAVGFVLAYPFAFKKDYAFDLSEDDREDLHIEREEDVLVYGIVTLNETLADSTINLLAPVIINLVKNRGKQIILSSSAAYPLRHPIGSLEGSVK